MGGGPKLVTGGRTSGGITGAMAGLCLWLMWACRSLCERYVRLHDDVRAHSHTLPNGHCSIRCMLSLHL